MFLNCNLENKQSKMKKKEKQKKRKEKRRRNSLISKGKGTMAKLQLYRNMEVVNFLVGQHQHQH